MLLLRLESSISTQWVEFYLFKLFLVSLPKVTQATNVYMYISNTIVYNQSDAAFISDPGGRQLKIV